MIGQESREDVSAPGYNMCLNISCIIQANILFGESLVNFPQMPCLC